jgi:hypothetical protein
MPNTQHCSSTYAAPHYYQHAIIKKRKADSMPLSMPLEAYERRRCGANFEITS